MNPATDTTPSLLQRLGGRAAVVLGGFAGVATLLLALADGFTREAIAARAQEDLQASLAQVIPATLHDNNLAADTVRRPRAGESVVVYRARRAGQVVGVAFELRSRGYAGDIRILLGVAADGRVLGVRVLQHSETPGLGDKIEASRSDWIGRFVGLSLGQPPEPAWAVRKDGGQFDQFAGATITPRAVVRGVRDGLRWFASQRGSLIDGTAEGPAP